ncbi:SGD1 (YLR336C) [Zygosaccharomyces parabailii]|nr:SGD1 (YLR336C) [Zygosaccharomyces parabailii]
MASKHGIRIPGILLDELKGREDANDDRFYSGKGKKRNTKSQLSRKEARKRQRQEKRNNTRSNTMQSAPKLKKKAGKTVTLKTKTLPFSSDDELSPDDFDEFTEESSDDKHEHEQRMTAEETLTALKAVKDAKNPRSKDIKTKKTSKSKGKETEGVRPLTPAEREAMKRDEMEMEYYAKKLGLKGKNKKIHARDEFDAIGGLLDGLEFFENFKESNDEEEEETDIESDQGSSFEKEHIEEGDFSEDNIQNPFSSDDELSSGDFDDNDELLDEDESEEDEDSRTEYEDSSKESAKANPFVAPLAEDDNTYVPPSLRKHKLAVEGEHETLTGLRKTVKSSLNKLSDSNITTIISSLNDLFDSNARQYVTDAIIKEVLTIICQSNKLLDGFIMNYAAVVFSLWKLRGTEVGALFIQSFVEKFLKYYYRQMDVVQNFNSNKETAAIFPKECSNLITLLAYCYNFGFISCKLIYDLIRYFVKSPNEFTTELLLKVVSISGPLIRGDDPSALKEIISDLLANVKSIKDQPVRLRFLLETMSDLKNNRLKPSLLATGHQSVKKVLQNVIKLSSSSSEPLQVTVDDIKSIDKKGKWWLVGASWKGNLESAFEEANNGGTNLTEPIQKINLKDDLLENMPDWSVIARQQRMNTDVRRAIFVSIMSAQDYMDAFTRLEKLNLKNKQAAEIPRVLIHCLVQDSNTNGYNPYYALLARRLCEYQHHLAKSFQFLFWDIVKKLEDEDPDDDEDKEMDEDARLRSVANRGRFFGFLISAAILPLDVFKHVPIISGLSSEGNLFVEVLLYQLLLILAKNSEIKTKDSWGKKVISFTNDELTKLLVNGIKLENRSVILKGLKWFITKKFKYKDYVGQKGDKKYNRDLRRIEWAVPTIIDIMNHELEGITY